MDPVWIIAKIFHHAGRSVGARKTIANADVENFIFGIFEQLIVEIQLARGSGLRGRRNRSMTDLLDELSGSDVFIIGIACISDCDFERNRVKPLFFSLSGRD